MIYFSTVFKFDVILHKILLEKNLPNSVFRFVSIHCYSSTLLPALFVPWKIKHSIGVSFHRSFCRQILYVQIQHKQVLECYTFKGNQTLMGIPEMPSQITIFSLICCNKAFDSTAAPALFLHQVSCSIHSRRAYRTSNSLQAIEEISFSPANVQLLQLFSKCCWRFPLSPLNQLHFWPL